MNPSAVHPPLENASKERLRLWLRLLKRTRAIESALRENFRDTFDTTLPRFDVMAALSRNEKGLKMSEISGVLRVSNGNVTGIVDRLVEDGHLVRVSVPGDRRASRVQLTEKGRDAFALQAAAHEAWIAELLGQFDAAQARAMAIEFDLSDPQSEDRPT